MGDDLWFSISDNNKKVIEREIGNKSRMLCMDFVDHYQYDVHNKVIASHNNCLAILVKNKQRKKYVFHVIDLIRSQSLTVSDLSKTFIYTRNEAEPNLHSVTTTTSAGFRGLVFTDRGRAENFFTIVQEILEKLITNQQRKASVRGRDVPQSSNIGAPGQLNELTPTSGNDNQSYQNRSDRGKRSSSPCPVRVSDHVSDSEFPAREIKPKRDIPSVVQEKPAPSDGQKGAKILMEDHAPPRFQELKQSTTTKTLAEPRFKVARLRRKTNDGRNTQQYNHPVGKILDKSSPEKSPELPLKSPDQRSALKDNTGLSNELQSKCEISNTLRLDTTKPVPRPKKLSVPTPPPKMQSTITNHLRQKSSSEERDSLPALRFKPKITFQEELAKRISTLKPIASKEDGTPKDHDPNNLMDVLKHREFRLRKESADDSDDSEDSTEWS